MNRHRFIWIGIVTLTLALLLAAARLPYFPGDVAIAKLVQAIAPGGVDWAKLLTETAKTPWKYILLGITCAVAWFLSVWLASLLSIASFIGMSIVEPLLKDWIARPRPAADLIHVAGTLKGYSMPSTFAVVYASTLGFLAILAIAKSKRSKTTRLAVLIPCCLLLLIGGIARIVLGAHWSSDILLSYWISGLWTVLLIQMLPDQTAQLNRVERREQVQINAETH